MLCISSVLGPIKSELTEVNAAINASVRFLLVLILSSTYLINSLSFVNSKSLEV